MAREKMVEGRLPKCFEVVSLKEQTFVVNDCVELKVYIQERVNAYNIQSERKKIR